MADRHFDAIVIGAGQAGPPLVGRLTEAGMRVAMIERRHFGGTCVNTGCTPTKAMIASARAAHMARRAADFGVALPGPVRVDMAAVKRRKDDLVLASRDGLRDWLTGMEGCTVFDAHARFEAPKTVRAGDATLTADRIFVNTGARATIPGIPGLDRVPPLTNTTLLDLDTVPDHLVIVGGSYVGLEFAQMFRRFGSRVTVLEKGAQIVAREDADVAEAIAGILVDEGIDVRTHAECLSVEPVEGADGTGVAVSFGTEGDGEPRHRVEGSHLLMAVGRTPNTDDLGLEAAGIACDDRGHIAVNDQLETSVEGVWALGDCNGQGAFTHTSYDDFQIVAANLLAGDHRRLGDRIPTYALYTDPPLGRAGLSERQVRESGRPAKIARLGMDKVGRARERGETQGFMKVLVDAETDRILGAAVLGIRGDEVVQGMLDVMYAGAPYSTVRRAMHIHPTVAELVPTMLEDLRPLD